MQAVIGFKASGLLNSDTTDFQSTFKLPVPSTLPEQRAIAAALSDVDALLAKLDQLIAKKRDLKQAAMQQLLTGQTRLPGFSGEWEVKRLGDIGEMLNRRTLVRADKFVRRGCNIRALRLSALYRKAFSYSKDLNHWVMHAACSKKFCVPKAMWFITPNRNTRLPRVSRCR